jgi:hypothetical protein
MGVVKGKLFRKNHFLAGVAAPSRHSVRADSRPAPSPDTFAVSWRLRWRLRMRRARRLSETRPAWCRDNNEGGPDQA